MCNFQNVLMSSSAGWLPPNLWSLPRYSRRCSVWNVSDWCVRLGQSPGHQVQHLWPGQWQLQRELCWGRQRGLVVQQVWTLKTEMTWTKHNYIGHCENDKSVISLCLSLSSRCHSAHLNGVYYPSGHYSAVTDDGVVWYTWRGWWYSLKTTIMKLRPVDFKIDPINDPNAVHRTPLS